MINTMSPNTEKIFKLIRRQLNHKTHPIILMINEFSKSYEKKYRRFVDKSGRSTEELMIQIKEEETKIKEEESSSEEEEEEQGSFESDSEALSVEDEDEVEDDGTSTSRFTTSPDFKPLIDEQ